MHWQITGSLLFFFRLFISPMGKALLSHEHLAREGFATGLTFRLAVQEEGALPC